jgi:pyruvate dehydrogenase E2 component (dihydrolipoamide acetyltransferase)
MREIKLASLGADMDEGRLIEWRVRPGDRVQRGQVVAVIDTTKAAIDLECWDEGIVDELIVEPGAKVPVGTVLGWLREPEESVEQAARWKAEHPLHPTLSPRDSEPAARRRISPAARKHAADKGIDLERVIGTGPQGAVTLADVERMAGQAPAPAPVAPADRAAEMRKTIAAAMARAKREIPHYYLATDIPLRAATDWLAAFNADRPVTERVLMAAVFIKACAKALAKFPELNGFHRDGSFEAAPVVHPGIAISLRQGGLIAPALLDAGSKPLDQLMRELTDLVKRARAFSLRASELSMATVTITNLGEQGVDSVFGVIYPPQVALIGFGRIVERAHVEQGAICAIPMVTASLSADHRASDGHRGGLFLNELKNALQDPERL